jgi:hypothetical protein
MAHFAKIENKIVTSIIVVDNCRIGGCVGPDSVDYDPKNHVDCGNLDFPETEPIGQKFINEVVGLEGKWIQTSYNNSFRKRYAGIGYIYDKNYDVFYPQQFDENWVLDKDSWQWVSPDGIDRVPAN